MKRLTGARRVAVIALSSLTCSLVSGIVALYIQGQLLSPNDGAYGMSLWATLADPFVQVVFFPLTLGLALLGFGAALLTLWHVNLVKAIPLVAAVAIGASAATEYFKFPFGPFLAFGATLLAMQWCHSVSGWSFPRPAEPSVFRTGLKGLAGHMRQGPK